MGGPPPEKQVGLSNVMAPRIARRPQFDQDQKEVENTGSQDEPYAWEAREFLRQKCIGKEVYFVRDYQALSSREFGTLYLGKDSSGENLTEALVSEGLAEVKPGRGNPDEALQRLMALQETAKAQQKGKWGPDSEVKKHVRNITWSVDNPRMFVDSLHQKAQDAVIEHVRDGSTVRALLLPSFVYVTVQMSGCRSPQIELGAGGVVTSQQEFAEEARYFTESRLLHRDVQIILEGNSNNFFVGSVLHPTNGNIAEFLLSEGLAKCVDWTIMLVTGGHQKLREAEKKAKDKRLRIWRGYTPSSTLGDSPKNFQGKVIEINNGDGLLIKKDSGEVVKVFLSSIRPPRAVDTGESPQRGKIPKPLYDYPFMFEAREFLRKRLIGKKVQVTVDYKQPAQQLENGQTFPEKMCCTVKHGGINLAEALVSKGLATVLRYKQGDENRSAEYDVLLGAEQKAEKSRKGLHGLPKKGEQAGKIPLLRVQDLQGDVAKSKQFLPYLQRAGRSEALVEFVSSGSRVRLYVPKETCLLTFLLSGINCPKGPRPLPGGNTSEGEQFWEEAYNLTKERVMQREVEIEVEQTDKAGNFVGYLFVDGKNLSEVLVEQGLATVHFTAERGKYYSSLTAAEERAKAQKLKMWEHVVEQEKAAAEEKAAMDVAERSVKYRPVLVTDVFSTLKVAVQFIEDGPKLEQMMRELRSTLAADPPLPGSVTPRRGDIVVAKFSVDNQWYRAKIDSVIRDKAEVTFIDYGNKEVVEASKLGQLPSSFHGFSAGAHEYSLALVQPPPDPEYIPFAVKMLKEEISKDPNAIQVNVEYRMGGTEFITLVRKSKAEAGASTESPKESTVDIGRLLIANGLAMAEQRKERRMTSLVKDYSQAQEQAKRAHKWIWEYGDFTGTEM